MCTSVQGQEGVRWVIRLWGIAGLCVLLMGCVAPIEVKQASGEVGVALDALQEAQKDFHGLYIRELEATRQLVARAIVSDAVVRKVGTLSQEEVDGDLIDISKTIQGEREAFQGLVNQLLSEPVRTNMTTEQTAGVDEDSAESLVNTLLEKRAEANRKAADALETAGQRDEARELRIRADQLGQGEAGVDQYDDLVVLSRLELTKADVRQGSAELEAYLQFLQRIHDQVNEWIATDVTVEGEEIAALMDKHSAVLELVSSKGGLQ